VSDTAQRVRVERIVGGGRALAHVDGVPWFIGGALPGEVVLATPERRRAGTVQAQAVELCDEPHPARCHDPCPHAPECGGCDWPHVEPLPGATLKAQVAAGGARPVPELAERLRAAEVAPSPPAYRLRATLHWDPHRQCLGFYARRSHRVVDITHCRLLSPTLTALRPLLGEALAARHCPAADVDCLESLDGSAAIVALRPAGRRATVPPPRAIPLAEEVEHQGLEGVHRIDSNGRLLEGWGQTSLQMPVAGGLEVPVGAFLQVNRHLLGWLASRVRQLAGPTLGPIYDLHAGVGYLAAATHAPRNRPLYLAETNPLAARAATRNLGRATVRQLAAATALDGWRPLPREAVALLDPPRSGLGAELTRRLTDWRPRWLISLGCEPAAWARDHARLMEAGYQLSSVELVDLFPFTHHVEILAVLEGS
jgi:23S rRNA (uracil1939-C5)-methyltransferase